MSVIKRHAVDQSDGKLYRMSQEQYRRIVYIEL